MLRFVNVPLGIQYGCILATFTQNAFNLRKSVTYDNLREHNSADTVFNCVTSQFHLHLYLAPWYNNGSIMNIYKSYKSSHDLNTQLWAKLTCAKLV
jgi:hypothetical protein